MNRQRASGGWWIEPALMAALAAIPFLLMARSLADGAIPWFMDPAMYFYPLRVHAARIVAEGEWPLWNRCLMGGVPLWANPQAAMAYPLHWPSLLWPGGFWFTFPQLLQLGLYGALTHWVVRRAGTGRAAALFAGAAALAGSYGWSRLQFGNYLNVLPWWPLWLGAATAFARRPAAHWAAAGVAAVAMPVSRGASAGGLWPRRAGADRSGDARAGSRTPGPVGGVHHAVLFVRRADRGSGLAATDGFPC